MVCHRPVQVWMCGVFVLSGSLIGALELRLTGVISGDLKKSHVHSPMWNNYTFTINISREPCTHWHERRHKPVLKCTSDKPLAFEIVELRFLLFKPNVHRSANFGSLASGLTEPLLRLLGTCDDETAHHAGIYTRPELNGNRFFEFHGTVTQHFSSDMDATGWWSQGYWAPSNTVPCGSFSWLRSWHDLECGFRPGWSPKSWKILSFRSIFLQVCRS